MSKTMAKRKPCIGDYVMTEYYKTELAKVKQQLAIAVEALKCYENKDNYDKHHQIVNGNNEWDSNVMIDCGNKAKEALQQIKELDK